jgi:hypothetical protein
VHCKTAIEESTVGFASDTKQQVLGEMAAEQQRAQRLMATGLVGQATITRVRETGALVNDNPVVEFDLSVAVDDRAPYPVTHRQVVSRLVVGNFAPGATVPVRVDPIDAAEVMIA